MPFSINIYDRKDLNAQTVFEVGERSSINLAWLGSDKKLEHILGSELSFNMEVANFQDGYFQHLNTQDERQFWVILTDESNGKTMWEGHLLPDSYEEPYKVGSFFVSFVAVCGLGTLKNQFLPNAFYEREHTIIAFLAEILKLTGLELDIYVNPAIRNESFPKWHQNYLDGAQFVDRDKKDDAYEILEKIISPVNRINQEKGAWYIHGLNKLNAFTMVYERYDHTGAYIGQVTVERSPIDLIKNKFLATPNITTNTPLKRITAVHDLDETVISSEVYKVKNDGYVVPGDTTLVNREWVYNSVGFTPKYKAADGKTYLQPTSSNRNNWVKLRKEVLLAEGDKVDWSIECTNYWDGTGSTGQTVEELVLNGYWLKLLPYDIYYTDPANGNEVIVYSNVNGANSNDLRYQLSFGSDRKAALAISMITPKTAYYNVRLYQPQGQSGAKVTGVFIDKLECVPISVNEEQVYLDVINDNYTTAEEVDLHIHDDLRQLKHSIRMSPLYDAGDVYDDITINNLEVMSNDQGDFIKLTLESLKAALANPDTITVNGNPLLVLGYIYNYLGSQEMYLQYDADDFGGTVSNGDSMRITLREYAPVPSNVTDWQSWTDDFYGISPKRYGEAVLEVVRRLFQKPHPVLRGTCLGFMFPTDLCLFNYGGDKVWYALDCQQHLDRFQTTLVLSQNFYGEAVTENLPPIVDAGPDKKLSAASTAVTLLATASDPDGTIVTVLWELISGNPSGVNIVNPGSLNTYVSGLSGDDYEFRVTVTDDSSLQASDTVRVARDKQYTLVLTQTVDTELSTNSQNQDQYTALDNEWYDISVSPELEEGQIARVVIDGVIIKETPRNISGAKPTAVFAVGFEFQFFEPGSHQMVLLFRRGDVKTLRMMAQAYNTAQYGVFPEYADKVYAKVQADISAEIIQGTSGVFTNVPIQKIVEARK